MSRVGTQGGGEVTSLGALDLRADTAHEWAAAPVLTRHVAANRNAHSMARCSITPKVDFE